MFLEKKQGEKEVKMDAKIIGNRLKILMKNKQIKRSYMAKKIGISYNTLTKKLNGQTEFSAIEIAKIKSFLELDEKLSANIFFNPDFDILIEKDIVWLIGINKQKNTHTNMGVFMKFKERRAIINFKKSAISLIQTTFGTLLMALSVDLFLLPNQLSVGGFSGLGTIGFYLFNIPVGTTTLILNIPLFVIALIKNGKKFFLDSLVGTLSLSLFLNLFENVSSITQSGFLACIYGGILSGIGTSIVLKANASTGGSDLLAQIAKSYKPDIKPGAIIVLIDAIVVIISTIVFGEIEIGLYSAIAIYIMGKVIDLFFEGIDFAKMIIIISSKFQEISDEINKEVKRGTTAIYGRGMYREEEKKLLLCVASRGEVREIRKIVNEIDRNAFLIITNAREVYGKGFK